MPSACWSLSTPALVASTSSQVPFLVCALVSYGLRKEPSWSRTQMRAPREDTLAGSGLSSIWARLLAVWYVFHLSFRIFTFRFSVSPSIFPAIWSSADSFQIPLGQNINIKANVTVNDGTYIAFIVLMFAGAVLALCLCNASSVIREDGTRVVLMKNPTWQSEFVGLWETIKFEPFVVLLFPMFWSSNWFTTYQQNGINGAHFDTRTKALNNCLYYLAQIVGALMLGYLLDLERFSRSFRAKACLIMLFVLTMVVWGGGYAWQKGYDRDDVNAKKHPEFVPTDWETPGYVGPMFLYIFYGFYDALWQASVYWYVVLASCLHLTSAN